MKIDINAFMESLPIMAVGLLGIFIVTIVIILGIYFLKAITSKDEANDAADKAEEKTDETSDTKKESAMDLMKEREKKDFYKEEESNYISRDL